MKLKLRSKVKHWSRAALLCISCQFLCTNLTHWRRQYAVRALWRKARDILVHPHATIYLHKSEESGCIVDDISCQVLGSSWQSRCHHEKLEGTEAFYFGFFLGLPFARRTDVALKLKIFFGEVYKARNLGSRLPFLQTTIYKGSNCMFATA